jgi:chromosome partitioning protein
VRIATVNLKGGVGKTTTAVMLAVLLARQGRTLLIDADPTYSALPWYELAPDLPFTVVGGAIKTLHAQMDRQAEGYAHVVIDCPPNIESAAITRSAAMAADVVIVPMPPSGMDVERLRRTLELLAEVEPMNPRLRVHILLTRVRSGTVLGREVPRLLSEELQVPLLAAEIPLREHYASAFGSVPRADPAYAAVLEEITT